MRNFDSSKNLRKQINLYFDNELNQTDAEFLMNKIKEDPKKVKIFESEKNFREFIQSNIKRPNVSSNLIENIKNIINI
jgi:hypothetical protein